MDYLSKIGLHNSIISIIEFQIQTEFEIPGSRSRNVLSYLSEHLQFYGWCYLNFTPKLNRLLHVSFDVIFYNLNLNW